MAGGGSPSPQQSGGKKSVDFQLNMVPFIDLLSVLISFLLMTSVWTQIARIDVKQSPAGADQIVEQEEEENDLKLMVVIKATGYTVTVKGVVVKDIVKKAEDNYDVKALSGLLKQIKTEHPENIDVTVSSEDKIPYKELITVMDVCLEHELKGISVAGVDA